MVNQLKLGIAYVIVNSFWYTDTDQIKSTLGSQRSNFVCRIH